MQAAVGRGVSQYVIIGAGMDSLALRQPAFARRLRIIEIDHPATQSYKRERLRTTNVRIPQALAFIAADLNTTSLDKAMESSS